MSITGKFHLDEKGAAKIEALQDAFGPEEFARRFPGVELWGTEVEIRAESEPAVQQMLAKVGETEVPERSVTRSIDQLRESNERLAAENRRLQELADRMQKRYARRTNIVAIVAALIGAAATLGAALFLRR
jgi:hypothetical protein